MDVSKSKKLNGNGFWESSRMMLPEHKLELIKLGDKDRQHSRPNVDFEAAEEIAAAVSRSYTDQVEITIVLFNPYSDRSETGIVEKVDQFNRRIKIADEWVKFDDIIGIQ